MFARTAGGLVCSHGSDLDTRIPRAKVPSSALPPEIRAKMGLKPRRQLRRKSRGGADPYAAGAGVLQPRASTDGKYRAGCQRNFLRRGSGKAMSARASRKAQLELANKRKQTTTEATHALRADHAHRREATQAGANDRRAQARARQRQREHQEHQEQERQEARRREVMRRKRAAAAEKRGKVWA